MRKVTLNFASLKVDFCDRDRAIRQVEDFAEGSTWHPVVVFGPEGLWQDRLVEAGYRDLKGAGF